MSHGMSAHVDKATFLEEDQFFSRESIMRPPACSLCPGPYQQLVHYCLSVASHQSAKLGIQPTEKTMAWARIILPLNMPVSIAPAVFFGVTASKYGSLGSSVTRWYIKIRACEANRYLRRRAACRSLCIPLFLIPCIRGTIRYLYCPPAIKLAVPPPKIAPLL